MRFTHFSAFILRTVPCIRIAPVPPLPVLLCCPKFSSTGSRGRAETKHVHRGDLGLHVPAFQDTSSGSCQGAGPCLGEAPFLAETFPRPSSLVGHDASSGEAPPCLGVARIQGGAAVRPGARSQAGSLGAAVALTLSSKRRAPQPKGV
jgi:hypothetical protein